MTFFEKIKSRTSVRDYANKTVEPEKIQQIITAINHSPTSQNSHDFSALIIKEPTLRAALALQLPSQQHIYQAPLFILFCADLNRIQIPFWQKNQKAYPYNLNQLITATGDAFIAASFAHSMALSLGLGCCFIGIVRSSIELIQKSLNLNTNVLPLVGLTIGYAQSCNSIKPKINKVYHSYDLVQIQQEVNEYDQIMLQYYDARLSNVKYQN